jgi:hypothetical protein
MNSPVFLIFNFQVFLSYLKIFGWNWSDMGVEETAARVALSSCAWDLQKATETLFN